MHGGPHTITPPAWAATATWRQALWRGARETPFTPILVLLSTFIGFGALTNETGLTLPQALFMTGFIFALPGQVVLVDQIAQGAALLAAAFAVTVTAVRLLPMTVALMPVIRDARTPLWLQLLVAHCVAVTAWLEAMRRTPALPRRLRAPYTLGVGLLLISTTLTGTVIGYALATNVPPMVSAGLLFMTPLYFLLSLFASARIAMDYIAIVAGAVLGPLLHLLAPAVDLLLTGLIGGSLSYGIWRWLQWRKGGRP